ncbi:ATP-binding cassette domain-containing protein [Desulforhopalus singaporensis]|uniref:ABC-2 type transport system ATP-binding protein n=1 Tax=Desulforhopalus singaporensis TaxID=91360 RepID=A0A1H0M5L3_9BACT|nr:ATP-binding cassette domain-containing protein [Desulforhopalus singaporensis]SDO75410.1 ABC-2 type transport system ATP-binding protein [Desulforhopalus singaporensis]
MMDGDLLAASEKVQCDPVLEICGLHKEFVAKNKKIVHALQDVRVKAMRGRVTGLVGADGAGKTTMIRIAAGLLVPTSGSVTVLGLDSVTQTLKVQSAVGYMPQKFGLYQDLSVSENMDLYADLQGVPRAERPKRYDRLLQMTSLAAYTRRKAGALSGGMKQKLGLACALIKSPGILLLDEPTVGVDPVSRRELWKIVYELVEKDNIGVFVSTSYLDEAARCDHVVVLHQGQVLLEGAPREFMTKMRGRVFEVAAVSAKSVRRLYAELAAESGVVDVTIRSGKVRVVTEKEKQPGIGFLVPEKRAIKPVEPSFEDAFMAMIPGSGHHFRQELGGRNLADVPDGQDDAVVTTQNLQKVFGGFTAVKDLSFTVNRGEIFGLLGPNGAGKSTTFRMLCGLLPASGGKISVAGYDLHRSRARARARLGYMAQQFSLYGQLSVKENLRFFGKAYGLNNSRLEHRIRWAYDEFGLKQWQDKMAASLPGGYKQRLAMAAALLHEPDILFLDEPTSGVDPFARREFWLRINGFAQQGVTVVVTTHFMEEAEYCDRMLIMSQGETLAMGSPAKIRELACSPDNPEPTMDDAFIALADGAVNMDGGTGKKASPEEQRS